MVERTEAENIESADDRGATEPTQETEEKNSAGETSLKTLSSPDAAMDTESETDAAAVIEEDDSTPGGPTEDGGRIEDGGPTEEPAPTEGGIDSKSQSDPTIDYSGEWIDATRGRISSVSHIEPLLSNALESLRVSELGDPLCRDRSLVATRETARLSELLQAVLTISGAPLECQVAKVCATADLAMEELLWNLRAQGKPQRNKIVAFHGSDHGRTVLCRTLSGQAELQAGFGPLVPGVSHVPLEDMDALRSVVDSQTACVIVSPIDMENGVHAVEGGFLAALRELCDQQDLKLVVDESRVGFGSTGHALATSSIASISADHVIVSAGLFGGLAGAMILSKDIAWTSNPTESAPRANPADSGESLTSSESSDLEVSLNAGTLPAVRVAIATLETLLENGAFSGEHIHHEWAGELAQAIGGFEFVRDLRVFGVNVGIETDLPAAELVELAGRRGLGMETSGDTAVRMQLPIDTSVEGHAQLRGRLADLFESIERQTVDF
ncbi:MAG: aminotransferase class III-fold pyridoxal phosphate-dependent enzyme [Planctomycetota bacterium]